jgi:hypothetical protein
MSEAEEVRLYLVREMEREAGWWSREFMRILFIKADGQWSHRVANTDWLPRGRTLPWRDDNLEAAKQRLLDAQDGPAYFENPGDLLPS